MVVAALGFGPLDVSAQEARIQSGASGSSERFTSGSSRISALRWRESRESVRSGGTERRFTRGETESAPAVDIQVTTAMVPNVLAEDDFTAHMFKNALYRDKVLNRIQAEEAMADAQSAAETALEEFFAAERDLARITDEYDGRRPTEIDADIAALDPSSPDLEADLAALEEERTRAESFEAQRVEREMSATQAADRAAVAMRAVSEAQTSLAAAKTAEAAALKAATNGRQMSEAEISYFQARLGL